MSRFNIGLMVSASYRVPRQKDLVYAPIDITTQLAQELAKRGHAVTLYAPQGSKLPGVTITSFELPALEQDYRHFVENDNVPDGEIAKVYGLWDQFLISQMFRAAHAKQHDLLHIQPVDRALPLALSHPEVPTLYTLHDPITPWRAELFRRYASPNQFYASISNAQRLPATDLNYAETVYNGIDLNDFQFNQSGGDTLLFVGRINPQKGVEQAIAVAKATGHALTILGSVDDKQYFETKVKPELTEKITYQGVVAREELHHHYQQAKALLFPLQWDEPFGLVMVEAMACGTPVIAYDRGSVSEIVENEKTGWVVSAGDEGAMREAVQSLYQLSGTDYTTIRHHSRQVVESKFTIQRMADSYEAIYGIITRK